MEGIRFVFFDIDYTLINEDGVWAQRCQEQALTGEAKALGLTPQRIYDEIGQASMAYLPQYRTVVRKFGLTEVAPYRHALEKPYPDALQVLQALSQKYGLGIIANQEDGLVKRLEHWHMAQYFAHVVSSFDYRLMKPDVRLFQAAVALSGCKAHETVMVGDRLDNDIFPAKSTGMKTIRVKQGFGALQTPRGAEYVPDMQVNSLLELLQVL